MKQTAHFAEVTENKNSFVKASKPCTVNIEWRNKDKFKNAREEVQDFLTDKLHYNLKKVVWAFKETRIAVRFEYEYENKKGKRYLVNGNENWDFDEDGLLEKKYAGSNDVKISAV